MNSVMPLPVAEKPLPSQPLAVESEHEADQSKARPSLLPALIGAAATMLSAVAMCRMVFSVKQRPRADYHLTPDQRDLLEKVIARGEQKHWDFSYDEDFIFKLLPALKAMTR